MTDAPIVPRPDQAVSVGIEHLARLRPGALPFATAGRYGDVFYGWRAELAWIIQRLVHEIEASRLETATGDALRDLCASEFDTVLPTAPLTAVGDVNLIREVDGGPGVIPKGTRFTRPAKSDPLLPRTQASYVSTMDVVVPQGLFHVPVPIVATRSGAFANTPAGLTPQGVPFGTTDLQLSDTLFDAGFSVQSAATAGGTDGLSDDVLKAAARAYAVGRYAPTTGAVLAAALLNGAAYAAVVEDTTLGQSGVLALDVSWATCPSWQAAIQTAAQAQGFGLRAVVFDGANTFVRVRAAITLRKEANVTDTSGVTAALSAAATAYFNGRPDWYTWRTAALRAALSRAHPAIRACTLATVIDAAPTSDPLSEPSATPSFATGAIHWALAPGAVQVTYTSS
jgi:hypothetical protein